MVEHKFDSALKKKYDLCVKRISNTEDKRDALVLFEGDEGEGKTNHSVCFADYVAQQTGRTLSNSNIRFKAETMVQEAKTTKRKIFIWDEPALQGLRKQWWNKAQINLTQLLMMARKNQHLFIFNITDFTEFNKYIIRRAIFMIRIYRRDETDKTRRFYYFPRKNVRSMWDAWNSKHRRMYNKFHTLHGTMPEGYLLPQIIDEELYEKDKDEAIQSIGEEDIKDDKLHKVQIKIVNGYKNLKAIFPDLKLKDYCKAMGISAGQPSKWRDMAKKEGISLENDLEKFEIPELIIDKGDDNEILLDVANE